MRNKQKEKFINKFDKHKNNKIYNKSNLQKQKVNRN